MGILGVKSEEFDAEDLQVPGRANELDDGRVHGNVMRMSAAEESGQTSVAGRSGKGGDG